MQITKDKYIWLGIITVIAAGTFILGKIIIGLALGIGSFMLGRYSTKVLKL